ncbi:MAG: tetratricopeptide repeat protein [Patescibacteria group bacterium]
MIYYLIPLIIIVASLIAILFIVAKKFPNLAAINVESIPKEKETQVINRIMVDRLSRNFLFFKKIFLEVFGPLWKNLSDLGSSIYQNIADLEKKNLAQPLNQIDLRQQATDKFEEAKKILAEGNLEKTEEICISIIEFDPKNLDAYQMLANVYLENRDYRKARETSRYLIKLMLKAGSIDGDKHRLANAYADLGWIYQLENKNSYALTNYQKAVELEPSNPRFLDLLLKMSIILKNKTLALEVFSNLKDADPDNQKLPDLEEEIKNLSGQASS